MAKETNKHLSIRQKKPTSHHITSHHITSHDMPSHLRTLQLAVGLQEVESACQERAPLAHGVRRHRHRCILHVRRSALNFTPLRRQLQRPLACTLAMPALLPCPATIARPATRRHTSILRPRLHPRWHGERVTATRAQRSNGQRLPPVARKEPKGLAVPPTPPDATGLVWTCEARPSLYFALRKRVCREKILECQRPGLFTVDRRRTRTFENLRLGWRVGGSVCMS